MAKKRALPQVLAAAGAAPMVVPVHVSLDVDTTASRTFPAFRASFKGKLRAASYMHEVDPIGTSILVKVRNATKAVDMTADTNVTAVVALGGVDLALVSVQGDLVVNKNDLITVVTTDTAITTAPAEVNIDLLFEWIKD